MAMRLAGCLLRNMGPSRFDARITVRLLSCWQLIYRFRRLKFTDSAKDQHLALAARDLMRPMTAVILAKESAIGLINGIALGILLGGAAILWQGNPYLGLVVGVSLAANTLVAVSLGGLIPLILRGMRTDPALASGPLLTTVTDMCGFFFVLSFASLMLPRLTG